MEITDTRQRALRWGYLLVTLPAVALVGIVLLLHKYLFVGGWPYYFSIGMALAYQWYTAAMPHWRTALLNKGLSHGEVEAIAYEGGLVWPGARSAGLLAVHTTAAGLCATYLNLWLAGQIVYWVLPLIGQPAPSHVLDFYLQHFELANMVPAFLLGCVMVRKFPELSTWAWLVPTAAILYKVVTFVEPNVSVLDTGISWRRFSYYFDIQRVASTMNISPGSFDVSGDPERVLAQITVVAAFYCSIAYSLGAFSTKSKAIQRVRESLSRESEPDVLEREEGDVAAIPNDFGEEPLEQKQPSSFT
jgi:hypothetical protein